MKSILDLYIDRVLIYANKPEAEAESIRQEIKDHLLQKVEDLVGKGMPREEALLEALRQHGSPKVIGYKLRGPFPWIDIRSQGTARGVIAIGPRAVGIFAFGGFAVGVFSFGGFSLGLFSAGGFALGLLFAWGGFGMGGIVSAGLAMGIVAAGGLALGVLASGGGAIGTWVPPGYNGVVISHYTAKNVPAFLKSMEPLMHSAASMNNKYFVIIMPLFLATILALNFLLYREGKRVNCEESWLIDG
jgi:hypothetical protein